MEAKDTILFELKKDSELSYMGKLNQDVMEMIVEQAEISVKAGMRKVANYANQFAGIKDNPEWRSKLKEWGI